MLLKRVEGHPHVRQQHPLHYFIAQSEPCRNFVGYYCVHLGCELVTSLPLARAARPRMLILLGSGDIPFGKGRSSKDVNFAEIW